MSILSEIHHYDVCPASDVPGHPPSGPTTSEIRRPPPIGSPAIDTPTFVALTSEAATA